MSTPVRFAVIVGVNDYQKFDASAGKAPGSSDLRGSVNDAKLYLRLARQLGVPDDNIRVLVAPADGGDRPAAFEGISGGLPTQANMEAAFDWLIAQLKANPGTQAILTYSGHGDVEQDALVLCPCDMTQGANGELVNAVHVDQVGGKLDSVAATNMITIFLDCCHAGDVEQGTRALRAGSRTLSKVRMRSNGHPLLAACRSTALSSEISFGDTHFGAFSWSITQVLGRWKEDDGEQASYGIAYGEAPRRASMLMNSLAVEQNPVYEGTDAQAYARFFTRADTNTKPAPDGGHRQLYPGDSGYWRIYNVFDKDGHGIIQILVTGPNYSTSVNSNFAPSKEYWYFSSSGVSKLQTTDSIEFQNYYTASSSSKNPSDYLSSGMTGPSYTVGDDTFKATSTSDSFSFNRLFERQNGSTGIGFTWGGTGVSHVDFFHYSSELVFTSSSNSGNLSNATFYAASNYYVSQNFS